MSVDTLGQSSRLAILSSDIRITDYETGKKDKIF